MDNPDIQATLGKRHRTRKGKLKKDDQNGHKKTTKQVNPDGG
jgi:hypothetical protein